MGLPVRDMTIEWEDSESAGVENAALENAVLENMGIKNMASVEWLN